MEGIVMDEDLDRSLRWKVVNGMIQTGMEQRFSIQRGRTRAAVAE
jgi:hypothetical protein